MEDVRVANCRGDYLLPNSNLRSVICRYDAPNARLDIRQFFLVKRVDDSGVGFFPTFFVLRLRPRDNPVVSIDQIPQLK